MTSRGTARSARMRRRRSPHLPQQRLRSRRRSGAVKRKKRRAPVSAGEAADRGDGETVGEAKWAGAAGARAACCPDWTSRAVRFQVVSEGERGLLGVGLHAGTGDRGSVAEDATEDVPADEPEEGERARRALVREVLERIGGTSYAFPRA